MAIPRIGSNFVNGVFSPDMFSKTVLIPFYKDSIVNKITNSDFLGELKGGHGQKIWVRKRPATRLTEYHINEPSSWDEVIDEQTSFSLDYAYKVQAKIDKFDKSRMDIDPMPEVVADIKEQMRLKVDTTVLGSAYSSATTVYDSGNSWLTAGNPLKDINIASAKLTQLGVPTSGRFLVLDPISAAYAKAEQALWVQNAGGPSMSPQKTGQVGTLLGGMEVYESANVTGSGTNGAEYNCMMGHRSAITLAVVLEKLEYFDKLEDYINSEGVRGLLVFGYGVCRPDALLHLKVQSAA